MQLQIQARKKVVAKRKIIQNNTNTTIMAVKKSDKKHGKLREPKAPTAGFKRGKRYGCGGKKKSC